MAAIASGQSINHVAETLSTPVFSKLSYLLYSTAAISFFLPLCRLIRRDYLDFIALGPGGTPSTFVGYLRISYLRLFTLKDPLVPPLCTRKEYPAQGYLLHLPKRPHSRPTVAGIAPHRQLNQKPPRHIDQKLRDALVSLVKAHPTLLRIGKSCFEKHGLGLFLSLCPTCPDSECHKVLEHKGTTHMNQTCADTAEICHLHATDSSMHLTLHPFDVALVITRGWGERHPLAGCPVLGKRLLPSGFVMVYAPQNETEVGVVTDIVRAGAWWVGGVGLGDGGVRGEGVEVRDRL